MKENIAFIVFAVVCFLGSVIVGSLAIILLAHYLGAPPWVGFIGSAAWGWFVGTKAGDLLR